MPGDFIYSALPEESIRLLKFSTNVAGGLVCNMSCVSMNHSPDYYALSYTWGTDFATERIVCNGLSMKITANLNEAVRSLLGPPLILECPIWIDAVSINQKDDVEKSVQVSRMRDIYRRARQVVVWLGPAENDSDIAMDWIERLSLKLPSMALPPMLSTLPEFDLPDERNQLWKALGHLYRRKWFGRLWTFQEAVLALDVKMVCGQKTVGWESLAAVARELNRLRLYPFCVGYAAIGLHEDGFRSMENVRFARRVLADYGPLAFPTLLLIADQKLCYDARDRVYAMLGMTSSAFRERIPVSYSNDASQSILQTFVDCAKACIEESMPVILQLVAGRPRISGLPSWCPDLSSNQGTILPFDEHIHAGLLPGEHPYTHAKVTPASNNLLISGFRMDIVSEVIEGTFHWPHVPDDQQIPRASRFLEWEARCSILSQRALNSASGIIPIDHIFTLSSNTRRRISREQDDAFGQAYLDILANVRRNARDGGTAHPPKERQSLYNDTWQQIFRSCAGRRYFSTTDGRLGLGPPGMKKGDIICIFLGAPPLFVLREAEGEIGEWVLIGDAFVHGLMELDDTLKLSRGADENFTII